MRVADELLDASGTQQEILSKRGQLALPFSDISPGDEVENRASGGDVHTADFQQRNCPYVDSRSLRWFAYSDPDLTFRRSPVI